MCLDVCTTRWGSIFVVDQRRRLARGLRLVATDITWSAGQGPEVTGPATALLLALAGRPLALADLDGPGLATLAERVGGDRSGVVAA